MMVITERVGVVSRITRQREGMAVLSLLWRRLVSFHEAVMFFLSRFVAERTDLKYSNIKSHIFDVSDTKHLQVNKSTYVIEMYWELKKVKKKIASLLFSRFYLIQKFFESFSL